MHLIEIKQIIKSKRNFDDYTIDILSEYLIAVQDCLSDYISLDEAINRLIENDIVKNGIIRVNPTELKTPLQSDASFSFNDKCVRVDERITDEMYIKYVMFHELTHALSVQTREDKNKKIVGLDDMSIGAIQFNHLGINEAVTEYLAMKMCREKYNYTVYSGYQVAVEQLINMMSLIDEKEIMNCYFYESEKFDELVRNNMFEDTKYFNNIFNILLEKEKTIVQIKRNEMPEDENNTVLSGIKDELYYWYTRKYFPMDNLEKFEEKLKFVKQFIEQHDSLNYIDEYGTYIDIICDMQDLEQVGVAKSQIDESISKYKIDKEKMQEYSDFNFTDSTGNDEKERTEKAIKMYEKYKELGRKRFSNICNTFFMRLYNDFFIGQPANNKDLYNYMKIPYIGKFLKENPQYDFDELSISKLNYSKLVDEKFDRNDWLYIITTQDKKIHIVSEEFEDGTGFDSKEIDIYDFILSYKQESMRIKFENGKITMQDLKNNNARFQGSIEYSKKSNYEQMKKMADSYGASGDKKRQSKCNIILEDMTKRISNRRKVIQQEESDIEI